MAFPKPHINKKGEPAKSPRKGIPLNKDQLALLIPKLRGNVSGIADALGCERHTVKRVIDNDPALTEALANARERRIDLLEDCVWDRAIDSNDTTLQLFLLKTQGRSRGYDQDEVKNSAKDIATAAFDFILNKSKNPAE